METSKNVSQLSLSTSIMPNLCFLLFVGQAVMEADEQPYYHGRITAEVHGPSADQVWPFFADFCNLYKIFPITVSFCDQGVPGRVGQQRFMATPAASDVNTTYVRWEKHNLTAIDPINRSLSYEIMENVLGLTTYNGTMSVLPADYGCLLLWEVFSQPFPGFTNGQLDGLLEAVLSRAAEKIENTYLNLGLVK